MLKFKKRGAHSARIDPLSREHFTFKKVRKLWAPRGGIGLRVVRGMCLRCFSVCLRFGQLHCSAVLAPNLIATRPPILTCRRS